MRKIRLKVDALRVESFATEREEAPRGTVEGHASRVFDTCRESCSGPIACLCLTQPPAASCDVGSGCDDCATYLC
ncbi:MAG TPA: hypothetical protein VFQ39_04630 [Longimicrobium sp.]|nr:hypothetical protein [Longimicrobium sp.]